MVSADTGNSIPAHICIIMDGNGRWATKRLMPRSYGHKKGVETTRSAVEYFAKAGVKHLTLFAFSSENWNRPVDEVNTLMELFLTSLKKNTDELNDKGIRIRFIGDRSAFSQKLRDQISSTESLTQNNQTLNLNIAANYGGQWDIINALQIITAKLENGELDSENIDQSLFESQLSLADTPEPDLFIRTGGEQRISNFLIWQLAYTELFFTDVLWPDFTTREMQAALDEYARRQRRYGKTGDQIVGEMQC
ncbi:MAG: di-trans,poly-cis-decaprenylcistransferase [Gammaproteobacteria bacterium]|nr:di-trans,poly-cis-decaprenylcistransferase [Gammaproteobacteria bacterium]